MTSPDASRHIMLLKINQKENTGPERSFMGKVDDSKLDLLSSISGTQRWKEEHRIPKIVLTFKHAL